MQKYSQNGISIRYLSTYYPSDDDVEQEDGEGDNDAAPEAPERRVRLVGSPAGARGLFWFEEVHDREDIGNCMIIQILGLGRPNGREIFQNLK